MKRIIAGLLIILSISVALSFFVKAEEKVVPKADVENMTITSNIRIDNSITKLNFFRKNINVIVIYK